MIIIDMPDPGRIRDKSPDGIIDVMTSSFEEHGFIIKAVRLKQYVEKTDRYLGPYSLITSQVQTDRGTIEMIYDEGFRGDDALNRTVKFLTTNLGISGLILRSVIALECSLEN